MRPLRPSGPVLAGFGLRWGMGGAVWRESLARDAVEQAGKMKSAIFCLWCACACVSCRPTQTGISPSAISNDPELSTLTADMGRSTNVIAVGEWSKPVKDAEGYVLRGRLLLFDTAHYSNQPPGTAI